ncbi:MAG: lytic transglycosylase domain-containing protein [Sulfuricella denitrificans]|nr:lytic transglycosylase domain-containing protein [Sulfuricella denitrificans]
MMFKSIILAFLIFLLSPANVVAGSADEEFMSARDAFRKGDAARLNVAAKRLEHYVLAPYLQYYQMLMRLKDASEEEVRGYIAANADSYLAGRLRADWLKVLGQKQEWTLFLEEYPLLGANEDAELSCLALQARLQRNDPAAFQEGHRKWLNGTESAASCRPVFEAMFAAGELKKEDVWSRIRLALESGNFSVARKAAEYLPEAQRSGFKHMEKVAENPQHFLESAGVAPQSRPERELILFAIYRLARSQPMVSLTYWERVRPQFSLDEQHYAWGQMAFHAARRHDPVALQWFREAGDAPMNELQLTWRVRAALRAQDWQQVLSGIAAMPEELQNQGPWRYWKARGLKVNGKAAAANAILAPLSLEHNFYGQLALEELGAVVSNPPVNYEPDEAEIRQIRAVPGIQRALTLYQLDLRTEANREWLWASRNFGDEQLLAAAELAKRNNWLDRAINTADKTRNLHDFSLRYPAPHRDLMQVYAREHGLDEAWVYGLIRQESRFVQQARSNVGASGLMQLMPATAKWIAGRMGMKHFRQSLVNQIDTNISFGTYYLKYVLDTNDGQPVLATASYNAGPSRARRWKDEKVLEGAIYAESIPFTETRGYVQKVMSNASYYANRFERHVISLRQRLGTIAGRGANNECQNPDERSPSCDP